MNSLFDTDVKLSYQDHFTPDFKNMLFLNDKPSVFNFLATPNPNKSPTLSNEPYVKPRFIHVEGVHRKLRKYGKRIGRRQSPEWSMFSGGKLLLDTGYMIIW